jgi:hypothetical protein
MMCELGSIDALGWPNDGRIVGAGKSLWEIEEAVTALTELGQSAGILASAKMQRGRFGAPGAGGSDTSAGDSPNTRFD